MLLFWQTRLDRIESLMSVETTLFLSQPDDCIESLMSVQTMLLFSGLTILSVWCLQNIPNVSQPDMPAVKVQR